MNKLRVTNITRLIMFHVHKVSGELFCALKVGFSAFWGTQSDSICGKSQGLNADPLINCAALFGATSHRFSWCWGSLFHGRIPAKNGSLLLGLWALPKNLPFDEDHASNLGHPKFRCDLSAEVTTSEEVVWPHQYRMDIDHILIIFDINTQGFQSFLLVGFLTPIRPNKHGGF